MSTKKKLLQAAAGSAGAAGGLNIEEVFSTYLYEGNGTSQTITNGIDLDGEGGLVWIKTRDAANSHSLIDTERGRLKILRSDTTNAEYTANDGYNINSFNSDGFTLGTTWINGTNTTNNNNASWTFRKAPKFFDVVTYTGDGVSGKTISHSLGTTVGTIFVKRTDIAGHSWVVFHRGVGSTKILILSGTQSEITDSVYWNNTAPTSTEFTVGNSTSVNASGGTYVAYLFAHNDGDGDFGPDGDADIIKCDTYNGADTYNKITLGFEPQWLLIKANSGSFANTTSWWLVDNKRSGSGGRAVYAQSNSAEATNDWPQERISFEPDGFSISDNNSNLNRLNHEYAYIAIRKDPMAVPEDATDVFATDVHGSAGDGFAPAFRSGFPVDMSIRRNIAGTDDWDLGSRLIQTKYIRTNSTVAETSESSERYDYMNGWWNSTAVNNNLYGWMWKRAPQFFDVVCHTGNGTNDHAIKHNLGVAPEMIWTKCRSSSKDWGTYVLGEEMYLNTTNSSGTDRGYSQTYDPTDTHFYLGTVDTTNESGLTYISFLFASLDGIAKVGTYTGNGSSLDVDCGFSNGARFVMVKRTDSAGNWFVFDTERGIVSGNDSLLMFNSNAAQNTSADCINPLSSGFTITNNLGNPNVSGGSYIFYAIA